MPRKALGRGLEALLPGIEADSGGAPVDTVAIESLTANPFQPRQRWDEEALAELAASIREHGVLQPVIARRLGDGYELVAGERRLRAARLAGLTDIPVTIVAMDDEQVLEVALIENLQREDLGPLEEARAYRVLIDRFGATQEEVARRVGRSRAQVANMLRLLGLDRRVQELMECGELPAGHGKVLAGVVNPETQFELARRCVDGGLSVRDLELLVRRMAGGKETRARGRSGAERRFVTLESQLRERIGARVRISGSEQRGTIRIDFHDRDALERVVQLLSGVGVASDVPRGTSSE